jgi:MoxR-like ATPase
MADLAPVIALGASPRATLALVRGAKALALLRGRTYATPQEIFDIAPEILRHRLILTYDALARDISIENVLKRILSTVPTMWVSPKPNDIVPRS